MGRDIGIGLRFGLGRGIEKTSERGNEKPGRCIIGLGLYFDQRGTEIDEADDRGGRGI